LAGYRLAAEIEEYLKCAGPDRVHFSGPVHELVLGHG